MPETKGPPTLEDFTHEMVLDKLKHAILLLHRIQESECLHAWDEGPVDEGWVSNTRRQLSTDVEEFLKQWPLTLTALKEAPK